MEIIIGVIAATLVTFIAYKKKSLSLSGVIAATILGTGIYVFGGEISFALLMVFFISSSLLSKVKRKNKRALKDIHEKGDARDYMQVIANGGTALFFLIIYRITRENVFFIASVVSFAASNSDTWASEIGVLSKKRPISIINLKPIEKGVSGGISVLGTIASFAGSAIIAGSCGILHMIFIGYDLIIIKYVLVITVLGFLGSIIDSIIGATVQAQYLDEDKDLLTEKRKNSNGSNMLVKGYSIVNNDVVNLTSNIIVSSITIMLL